MPILQVPNSAPPVTSGPFVKFEDQPVPLSITYVDPDGTQWVLSDRDMPDGYICTALKGLSGAPVTFSTIPLVTGGSIPQLLIRQNMQLVMGLLVQAKGTSPAAQTDYLNLLDAMTLAFTTIRKNSPSPGTLVIGRPDGTQRFCRVYQTSGLDQPDDDATQSGLLFTSYALTLVATDPYFYDLTAEPFLFDAPAEDATGILPLLPIALTGATSLGDVEVTNRGSADAYPMWTITGPGTPTIENVTTGLSFTFGTPLDIDQVVIIVTQPGLQSVTDATTDENLWGSLVTDTPRDLFALVQGVNKLSVDMADAGDDTSVVMEMTQRWLRA
jgi:hypothetical protein